MAGDPIYFARFLGDLSGLSQETKVKLYLSDIM